MKIESASVYKRSSERVIKDIWVESFKDIIKEYKQLLEKVLKKTSIFKVIFKKFKLLGWHYFYLQKNPYF